MIRGEIVGFIQFSEEPGAEHRHADVEVGVARLGERAADGSRHDELLMELVVEPRPG